MIVDYLSPTLFKASLTIAAFLSVAAIAYLLLRGQAERSNSRAGLDDALWNSPAVAEARVVAMRGGFGGRVLGPAVGKLAEIVYRFGPKGLAEQTRERLVLAGLSDRLDPDMFFGLSALVPLGMGGVMYALSRTVGIDSLFWLVVPVSIFFPKMWLTKKVEARQLAIQLALPDTLDLLTISVEAGLGFDAALDKVVRSIQGPLSDELYRMLQELKIGLPRTRSLRSLAARTQVPELDQFITALSQADNFGISIGNILRTQGEQLRTKRSQIAEERAAKTPVKLLFPLLVCIFPGLFVVLVGPAAIGIMDNFLNGF